VQNWESLEALCADSGFSPIVISRFRGRQQVAICATQPAESSWYEAFPESNGIDPPRGFAFAAFRMQDRHLLLYCVHLKSNAGGDSASNQRKREESARQLVNHLHSMRSVYGEGATAVIAGDFNTDPTQDRFADERTMQILTDAGLHWCWQAVPFRKRVTLPADGRWPDACFDGFFSTRKPFGTRVESTEASDHRPVILTLPEGH